VKVPYELFLAVRYLRFHRGRTFLSVITLISVVGVGVGTAALVIALSLMAGFDDDLRARIHSGSAHLTIMSTFDSTFDAADEVMQKATDVTGIAAAGPVLYSPAMLVAEGRSSTGFAEVHGVDPQAHVDVIFGSGADTGADPGAGAFARLEAAAPSGRHGIVIGSDLASTVNVREGDMVRVLVPRITLTPWAPQPRSQLFEVVGVYHSGHFQQDSVRSYVSIDAARGLLRAGERSSWIEVRLDDVNDLGPMKKTLQAALDHPWLVIDLIEQNQDLIKALNTEKLLLFLAIGLIVVVAALNIVSTLILMVTDKVKEIGTLSAMGARPKGIATVFILQGLFIGIVGTVCGLVLGTTISLVLDRYRIIALNPDVYYLTHLPFSARPLDIALVGLAAVLVSLLATIHPAVRAAKLNPVEAIRYE